MPKDYYLILGIPSGATLDEIKEAYRRLAKEFHPDHYGDNNSPFLAIQEAYSVLSDPIRRQAHDLAVLNHKEKLKPVYVENIRPALKRHVEPLIPEHEAPMVFPGVATKKTGKRAGRMRGFFSGRSLTLWLIVSL